ncbi:MAG: glycosyltransferase family 39 protein [Anaerolineae bacterium]
MRAWLVALLLVIAAFLPRAVGLAQFATWDELFWTHATLRFWRAVDTQRWPRTYIIGQPGVVSMWLGSAPLTWRGLSGGPDAWETIGQASRPRYSMDDTAALGALADYWRDLPVATALATSLAVGAIYLLARRLFGARAALVAGILVAFDPAFLGHSRLMTLDAVLASLMLLSVLTLLIFLRDRQRQGAETQREQEEAKALSSPRRASTLLNALRAGGWPWLVASGALGGLAALQKTTGVFLLGYVVIVGLVAWWTGRRPSPQPSPKMGEGAREDPPSSSPSPVLGEGAGGEGLPPPRPFWERGPGGEGRAVLGWAAAAVVTYVAAWPAMWSAPGETLTALYNTLRSYAPVAYDPTFFLGEPTAAPGVLFYPLVFLFRTTPLTLLGLALLGWTAVDMARGNWCMADGGKAMLAAALLVLYAVLFGAFLSLSAAKFERYLLPALLPLNVAAGVGLAWGVSLIAPLQRRIGRTRLRLGPAILGVALLLQSALVLSSYPYYLAWYNPLLGGQRAAANVLPLGIGEGMEGAAHYLAAQPKAEALKVASWGAVGLAPWFAGDVILPEAKRPWQEADYAVVYITDVQRGEDIARQMAGRAPVFVGRVGGMDYVWVYRMGDSR